MKTNIILKQRRYGLALPLVMCCVLILSILGIALLTLGYQARLQAVKTVSQITARASADAALTKALYDMNQQLKTGTWNDSTLPSATNVVLPACNAIYSYTVAKNGSDYVITATGTYNGIQKQVTCTLNGQQSLFDCAVFGDQSVTLYNSSTIDQYNNQAGDPPLTVGTNSTTSGAITLKNSAKITGNVVVGVGGDPTPTGNIISLGNSAVITGNRSAETSPKTLTSVTVPSAINSLSSSGTLSLGNSGATTISASTKYSSISLSNSAIVTISGNVTLYVTGNVSLGNSAQIKVNQGSSLTIYLGGNLTSSNSSSINNLTQNPQNAQLYGLDTCTSIGFKNSSAFYGAVYAPKADVTYNNSAAMYGSIIAKSFQTKNSAAIHYDASLKNISSGGGPSAFAVKWWSDN